MIMQNMIIFFVLKIRHGLDCSYYDTIEDELVMGTGRKV